MTADPNEAVSSVPTMVDAGMYWGRLPSAPGAPSFHSGMVLSVSGRLGLSGAAEGMFVAGGNGAGRLRKGLADRGQGVIGQARAGFHGGLRLLCLCRDSHEDGRRRSGKQQCGRGRTK